MRLNFAHFSQGGRKPPNEDSILPPFEFQGTWWAAVADGMGGRPGGAIASDCVLEGVKAAIELENLTEITGIFEAAQNKLKNVAAARLDLQTMGTTLSLIRLNGVTAEVGHVGDSRIYHLRGDGIVDRTVDQTEVEQLIQQGVLSRARARRYPRRHILLSVLSPKRDYDLYRCQFQIKTGDRLILLTDGVSSKLLRQEIRDLSLSQPDAESLSKALQKEITVRNAGDDYSAICIDIQVL
jgi:serine/threonine protein phosphatase PrpC